MNVAPFPSPFSAYRELGDVPAVINHSNKTEADNSACCLDKEREAVLIPPVVIEPAIDGRAVVSLFDLDAFHLSELLEVIGKLRPQGLTLLRVDSCQDNHRMTI